MTTRATTAGAKAVWLAAPSLLTELIGALQAGTAYNLGLALVLGLGTFIIAVSAHYGLLKPTGISDKAADVVHTSAPQH